MLLTMALLLMALTIGKPNARSIAKAPTKHPNKNAFIVFSFGFFDCSLVLVAVKKERFLSLAHRQGE